MTTNLHRRAAAAAAACPRAATVSPWWARGLSLVASAVLAACAGLPGAPTPGVGATSSTESGTPVAAPVAQADSPSAAVVTELPVVPTGRAAPGAPAAPDVALATLPTSGTAPAPDSATQPLITIDPLQPTVRLDLDSGAAQSDLWVRLRSGYAVPDMDGDLVRKWEQFYAGKPEYMQRMTERGGRYLFHIVEETSRRGLPAELALLPFIESAFNPQAMSTAKASGMWQFIPGTGRDYDLRQNIFRDDRRDVLASTRAALDYLKTLHGMFGDWKLALAAYNWGQGNVQRAIKRNQAAGLPTDYASLQMPDETRNYYPKLQAVKNIVGTPEAFAITLPALRNHPYFVSVGIDRDIDIELAARLAGLGLDEFKQLNPQMNKPVILAAGTPQVLLPYDNANAFVKALSARRGALATWTAWVAPRTMKAAEAAREVSMSEEHMRQVNNIPPRMLVKAGSTLLVPRDPRRDQDVTEQVADNATLALAPDLPPFKRVAFRAGKRGDSVAAVARRYRVSPAAVAQWNRTSVAGRFRRGDTVVVMVPVNARAAVAAVQQDEVVAAAEPSTRVITRRVKGRNGKMVVVTTRVPVPAQGVATTARGKAAVMAAAKTRNPSAGKTTGKATPKILAKASNKAAGKTVAKAGVRVAVRAGGGGQKRALKPGPAARARVAQN